SGTARIDQRLAFGATQLLIYGATWSHCTRTAAHYSSETGDLVYGFAFHSEGGEESSNLSIRALAGHDLVEDCFGFGHGQILSGKYFLYCFGDSHRVSKAST